MLAIENPTPNCHNDAIFDRHGRSSCPRMCRAGWLWGAAAGRERSIGLRSTGWASEANQWDTGGHMAVLKFRLDAPVRDGWSLDPEFVHVLDFERVPYPMHAHIEDGLLICRTATTESLRVQAPWALPGRDPCILGTSTLPSRQETYLLVLELARGRLTDLRHFFQEGSAQEERPLPKPLLEAHAIFVEAVLHRDDTQRCASLATKSLQKCLELAELQLSRHFHSNEVNASLADKLSLNMTGLTPGDPLTEWLIHNSDICRIGPNWRTVNPQEDLVNWADWETPVKIAHESGMTIHCGPLIDFSADSLPGWLKRYDDITQLCRAVSRYVSYVVRSLKSRVHVWHVVRRPAMAKVNGLTEEHQIKITMSAIQAVTQNAPEAEMVVDLTAPWAEWLSRSGFELGPLHLADTLARADLGLTGIGLEMAMGYPTPGSHLRELFDISKLIQLYHQINLPLHLTLAAPGSPEISRHPDMPHRVGADPRQWPSGCDQTTQAALGMKVMSLAAMMPGVRTIHWANLWDAPEQEYAFSGVFTQEKKPKSLAREIENIRRFRSPVSQGLLIS
jgi:hypothetical protein